MKTEHLLPKQLLLPFIQVTTLFALWGFANDVTNPLVAAFKNVMLISNFESSLVQFAFYGGYCVMALPAALFIKRFSYKAGILVGLSLYSCGCFLFIPSTALAFFPSFLLAYFIMTCGLSFLETSANPYILALGPAETATRRLNFAQAFNPIGSLTGMLIAKNLILARLDTSTESTRTMLQTADPEAFMRLQRHDLAVITGPYIGLGLVILLVLIVFFLAKLPLVPGEEKGKIDLRATLKRLAANRRYREGVLAQLFYVGVQIMCWTFIIQYAETELGMPKTTAQLYNMVAMGLFVGGRFICTVLLRYFSPGKLLAILAGAGGALILGTVFIQGIFGLYCLVGVSACMSLMFPTIYGIALQGLGDDAKLGAAGLIMAIGGGCLMPPLQGLIMDQTALKIGEFSLSSARASFLLPFVCFVVVFGFGWRTVRWRDEEIPAE